MEGRDKLSREIRKKFEKLPVEKIEVQRAKPDYISLEEDDVSRMKDIAKKIASYAKEGLDTIENLNKLKNDGNLAEALADLDLNVFINEDLTVRGIDRDLVSALISLVGGENTRLLGVSDSMVDYCLAEAYKGLYAAIMKIGVTISRPLDKIPEENKVLTPIQEAYVELYGRDKLIRSISSSIKQLAANQGRVYETSQSQKLRSALFGAFRQSFRE